MIAEACHVLGQVSALLEQADGAVDCKERCSASCRLGRSGALTSSECILMSCIAAFCSELPELRAVQATKVRPSWLVALDSLASRTEELPIERSEAGAAGLSLHRVGCLCGRAAAQDSAKQVSRLPGDERETSTSLGESSRMASAPPTRAEWLQLLKQAQVRCTVAFTACCQADAIAVAGCWQQGDQARTVWQLQRRVRDVHRRGEAVLVSHTALQRRCDACQAQGCLGQAPAAS